MNDTTDDTADEPMGDAIRTIGLISDTHGLLRSSATKALEKAGIILHAGDIDSMAIIDELELIAPVYAVRGNMDFKPGVDALPDYLPVKTGGKVIGVIHDRHSLGFDPAAKGVSVVVHGHTHKASVEESGGVLYVNPGSAGPPRSGRRPSVGILRIENGRFVPEIIPLDE